MNATNKGVIQFNGYRLLQMKYECIASFSPKTGENGSYHFNIGNGFQEMEDGSVQINLMIIIFFSETEDYETAPLKAVVELAGKFIMQDHSKWDHRYDSNAIAILYPYARAILSSVTAQSGREPIILPTVNTATLLAQK